MQPSLIILAAGMGSRYGSLKQVDQLGPQGQTIIDYSINDAIKAGFEKIVFVIRKQIQDEFIEVFGPRLKGKISFEMVFQELDMLPGRFNCPPQRTKPWGTAHALWVCRDVINEPFVVINADDYYGEDAYHKLARHLEQHPHNAESYAMCGYKLEKTLSENGSVTRGICKTDQEGYLVSVDEHYNIVRDQQGRIVSKLPEGEELLRPDDIVSMNIWAFHPDIFGRIEEELTDFLKDNINSNKVEMPIPKAIDSLIGKKQVRIKVLQTDAKWLGVTYAADRDSVSGSLRRMAEEKD